MKRSFFALFLAGLVLLTGFAIAVRSMPRSTPVDAQALNAANELVAAGHTAEAAQMIEQMIAQGAHDAALYYNLGNAYFLQGDASRAVTAYKQAAALAPRDADIQANLALAQGQAHGQVSRSAAAPLGSLATAAGRWLTGDELALLALGAWFALGLLVFGYRGLPAARRPAVLRVVMVAALLVVLATGSALASRLANAQLAIPPATAGQQAAIPDPVPNPM